MSVEFTYCEEGALKSYIKVAVIGYDQNDDKVKVTEMITPQELLRVAADLIDQNPYYKDFFDKRLLG